MKTTVVPAQVTTVEDKVAGNLSLSQLLLLTAPVFMGAVVYGIFPPVFHNAGYKLVIVTLLILLCASLAIRIKGKILLLWAIVLARYNLRPHYYVYNKNDMHLRERPVMLAPSEQPELSKQAVAPTITPQPKLTTAERVLIEQLITNPDAKLRFEPTSKGGLRAFITEPE